jgi:uncharacterized protein (DUF305 family)
MKIRNAVLPVAAVVAALILTGCAATSGMQGMDHPTTPPTSSAGFNNADETFAREMIAHHQQAIEMADLVLDKEGVDERVTNLALAIKEAQGPEIETMTQWLTDWGLEPADGGMGGMDHSSGGMMSDDDMAALEQATGAEASSLFLEQMTMHHQGAIDMAQQELDNGENPDAIALAAKIIDDQTAEIATMQDILSTL